MFDYRGDLMEKGEETREKILLTTKKLLNADGIESLSVRKIASTADVNVASINYYFRSKNELIFECMKDVIGELEETVSIFENKSLSEEERIKEYLNNIAEIILKNQAVQISLLKTFHEDIELPEILQEFISRFYSKFKEFLKVYLNVEDEVILSMIVEQSIAGVWFPIISYKTSSKIAGIDFKNQNIRKKYIDLLVENIKGRIQK